MTPKHGTCVAGERGATSRRCWRVLDNERFRQIIVYLEYPGYTETFLWCGGHFDPERFYVLIVDKDFSNALCERQTVSVSTKDAICPDEMNGWDLRPSALKGLEPPTSPFSRYVRAEYSSAVSCLLSRMTDMGSEAFGPVLETKG